MTFTRTDNRAADELRAVKITPNFLVNAEGSALIEMGNTRVICAASVEDKLPPHLRYQRTEGWVTAEYGMLPRSTHTRSAREIGRGGPSGRRHAHGGDYRGLRGARDCLQASDEGTKNHKVANCQRGCRGQRRHR